MPRFGGNVNTNKPLAACNGTTAHQHNTCYSVPLMVECWYWFIFKAFIWFQLWKHGTRLCGIFVYIMSFVYEWCLVFECSWIFVKKGPKFFYFGSALASRSTNFVDLNSTQLNSTNHPKRKRVVYKRKEAIKAYINPRFLSKQSRCFLKVATVSQLINDTGKLFHTSIILTVKKFFLTSKFTCGL